MCGDCVPDDLIAHLETHLGPLAGGWAEDSAGVRLPFQIVWFPDAPSPGLITFATLGMSRHVLHANSKDYRLELVMSIDDRFQSARIVSALVSIGEEVVARHEPLRRGDIVRMGDGLAEGSPLASLYVAAPTLLPDTFAVVDSTEPPTAFAWLIPITGAEVELVERHGWPWFEDRLEREQPDLFDLQRRSIPDGPM